MKADGVWAMNKRTELGRRRPCLRLANPIVCVLLLCGLLWPMATALASPGSAEDEAGLSGKVVFQTVSGGEIYIINADGTDLRLLTHGMDPAFSPDGEWVAFTRWDEDPGLFIIRADGSDERKLFDGDQVKAPAWSPDGAKIAITYQHGGHKWDWVQERKIKLPDGTKRTLDFDMPADPHWKLGVVQVEDGRFGELYCHDYSYSPTWSVDGAKIVYRSDRGIAQTWEGIDSAATQDPNTYQVTPYREVDHSPVFSPDGTKIAIQYRSHDHYEIMVMNPDGSGRTLLTKSPVLARTPQNSLSPDWSPDGSQIAFLTDRTGKWEIWVMNADGSNQRPMFPAGTLNGITIEYHNVDERMLSWQ